MPAGMNSIYGPTIGLAPLWLQLDLEIYHLSFISKPLL